MTNNISYFINLEKLFNKIIKISNYLYKITKLNKKLFFQLVIIEF